MKLEILAGATSVTVNVFIQDSSSATGAGLSGLVYNSSGLTAYYSLPQAASAAITLATLAAATSAWSSGGFKEIDATNMKGWYRFDIPNAALASGRFVSIHLQGATNMAPLPIEIALTAWDNQVANIGANLTQMNGSATPVTNLAASALGVIPGTAQTGTLSTTQMTTNLTFINTDQVAGRVVVWTSGNLIRQARTIIGSSTAGLLTFATAGASPANNDTFVII